VATVEAGRTDPWRGLAGPDGLCIGIDRFGASAPATVVARELGMTAEAVTEKLRDWLG
jgi:transketolase